MVLRFYLFTCEATTNLGCQLTQLSQGAKKLRIYHFRMSQAKRCGYTATVACCCCCKTSEQVTVTIVTSATFHLFIFGAPQFFYFATCNGRKYSAHVSGDDLLLVLSQRWNSPQLPNGLEAISDAPNDTSLCSTVCWECESSGFACCT